jgi:hypothetical protein
MEEKQKAVVVRWVDITSLDGGWLSLDEIKDLDVALIKTAGWIVKETQKKYKRRGKIWIASSLAKGGEVGGHPHCIPKGCIVDITEMSV